MAEGTGETPANPSGQAPDVPVTVVPERDAPAPSRESGAPIPAAASAPAPPAPASPGTAPAGELWENGQPFNAERAISTIRKLQDFERQTKPQLRELDELRQYRQQAEDAKLSEQERLSRRMAEIESERAHLLQDRQARTLKYETQLTAARLGIVDPDAAYRLLDPAEVEYDEEGTPTNLEACLKTMLQTRPYLLPARTDPVLVAATPTSATNPQRAAAGRATSFTREQIADRAFWDANKADIMVALAEGRIE